MEVKADRKESLLSVNRKEDVFDDSQSQLKNTMVFGIGLLFILAIITMFVGSIRSNSMIIYVDFAHLLAEFANFVLAVFSFKMTHWKPTKEYTFGYYRVEVIFSILTTVIILFLSFNLIISSVSLIFDNPIHHPIDSKPLLIFSSLGLMFNVVISIIFRVNIGDEKQDSRLSEVSQDNIFLRISKIENLYKLFASLTEVEAQRYFNTPYLLCDSKPYNLQLPERRILLSNISEKCEEAELKESTHEDKKEKSFRDFKNFDVDTPSQPARGPNTRSKGTPKRPIMSNLEDHTKPKDSYFKHSGSKYGQNHNFKVSKSKEDLREGPSINSPHMKNAMRLKEEGFLKALNRSEKELKKAQDVKYTFVNKFRSPFEFEFDHKKKRRKSFIRSSLSNPNNDMNLVIKIIGDLIQSLVILVTCLTIYFFPNLMIIDRLLTIFIASMASIGTIPMFKQSLRFIMEGRIENIDSKKVKYLIENIQNVKEIKCMHIWNISYNKALLQVKLILKSEENEKESLNMIETKIREEIKFCHINIEIIKKNFSMFRPCK